MTQGRATTVVALLVVGLLVCPGGEAHADAPALRCQKAIEDGGVRYARRLLREIDRCARAGVGSMDACLDAPATRTRLDRGVPRWRKRVARACANFDVHSTLGYLETCAPADTTCGFGTASVVEDGARNDLLDCAECRIEGHLRAVADRLFAGVGAAGGCRGSIARPGVELLEDQLRALARCARRPNALSLAGCLSEPSLRESLAARASSWRARAAARCGNRDPFAELGYERLCSGLTPPIPAYCSDGSPPCTFAPAIGLNAPGADNDLLDCLQCRADEAVLAIARDLFGANLCCDGRGCRAVRTRRSCHAAGGSPVYYRQHLIPEVPVGYPHGMAIADDGTVWMPDRRFGSGLWEYTGPGALREWRIYPEYPDAVTLDASGRPVITSRESNRVLRLEGWLDWSVVAFTGQPGHSGDGGPALDARAAAPIGLDYDSRGTLYVAETGLLAAAFQGVPSSGEYVRAIDPIGRVRTVAGAGPYGVAGHNGPALAATLGSPYGLHVRSDASILIGEAAGERLLDLDPGALLAHRAGRPGSIIGSYSGDGGPAVLARFNGLEALASDREGNILVGDFRNGRVRLVDRLGSVISILGRDDGIGRSLPAEDDIPASLAWGGCPGGLAVGPDGRVYVGDGQHEILRVLTRTPY